jgi:hypothetical protein
MSFADLVEEVRHRPVDEQLELQEILDRNLIALRPEDIWCGHASKFEPAQDQINQLYYQFLEQRNDAGLAAIKLAFESLSSLFWRIEAHNENWVTPRISDEGCSEVAVKWSKDEKSLTFFFGSSEVSYLKTWGLNINSEMDDGDITNKNEFQNLWEWLKK